MSLAACGEARGWAGSVPGLVSLPLGDTNNVMGEEVEVGEDADREEVVVVLLLDARASANTVATTTKVRAPVV